MERVKGIEPSSQPWEGHILPLNHTRLRCVRLASPHDTKILSDCHAAGNWFAMSTRRFKLADGGSQCQFNCALAGPIN